MNANPGWNVREHERWVFCYYDPKRRLFERYIERRAIVDLRPAATLYHWNDPGMRAFRGSSGTLKITIAALGTGINFGDLE